MPVPGFFTSEGFGRATTYATFWSCKAKVRCSANVVHPTPLQTRGRLDEGVPMRIRPKGNDPSLRTPWRVVDLYQVAWWLIYIWDQPLR